MDKIFIYEKANEIKDWLIEVRRDLHKTPELGMEEYITREKIKKYLDEIGIEYLESENHTGITGIILNPSANKTIALRADIDALPIEEKNTITYKSIHSGKMHACGHDAHTAILLGVAKILSSMRDQIPVNVKLFFQPAEETVGGAQFMIEDGCLDNPKVDYILGLHVMPNVDTGYIEVKYNTLNASTDTIKITVNGKQAHGAYPENGVDAIVIGAHIITALQTIVSRNIAPTNSVVLSLGIIKGGIKENIICDKVEISGTLRTLDAQTRNFAKERICKIVKDVSSSFGGVGIVDIEIGYSPLVNDNYVVDIIKEQGKVLLGEDKVLIKEHPSLGAEDFSFFLENTKGAFFHLGCKNTDENITSPLHTSEFNIDEDCLPIGVAMQIMNLFALSKV
jgi:amidohydrolase